MSDKTNQNNKAIKIVIPILILVIVGAIGIFKLTQKEAEVPQVESGNPDFAYNVTGELDVEKLKSYNLPIIIEFGADWCPPCQQMAPIVKKLNEELQGKAILRYVNVDKIKNIDYNFQSIPTQLFINADGSPYKPTSSSPVQMDLFGNQSTGAHVYTLHTGVLSRDEILKIFDEMGMK